MHKPTISISHTSHDRIYHLALDFASDKRRIQVLIDVEVQQLDPETLDTAIREELRKAQAMIAELELDKLPIRKPARYSP